MVVFNREINIDNGGLKVVKLNGRLVLNVINHLHLGFLNHSHSQCDDPHISTATAAPGSLGLENRMHRKGSASYGPRVAGTSNA